MMLYSAGLTTAVGDLLDFDQKAEPWMNEDNAERLRLLKTWAVEQKEVHRFEGEATPRWRKFLMGAPFRCKSAQCVVTVDTGVAAEQA